MVCPWVGDDEESGLLERLLDLIGECAGSVSASDGSGASSGSELQNGALSVRARGNDAHVSCKRRGAGANERGRGERIDTMKQLKVRSKSQRFFENVRCKCQKGFSS